MQELAGILEFLSELKANNDRTWFEANKERYLRAKASFEVLIARLLTDLGHPHQKPSACVFRIYRDVRFAKDKSPYKTAFGAVLAPGGTKSPHLGVYLHLEPFGNSMIAGGLYAPEPAQLKKFRADMEDGPRAFQSILGAPAFLKCLTLLESEKLKRLPASIAPDHPGAELIKLKQVVAIHRFSDEEVTGDRFYSQAVECAYALKPFLDYLEEAVGIVASTISVESKSLDKS